MITNFVEYALQSVLLFLRVNGKSEERKKALEVVKKYYQFLQDAEEEERWAQERIDNCRSTNTGKDLNAALMLLKKHEVSTI
jgi:hypothetical protein